MKLFALFSLASANQIQEDNGNQYTGQYTGIGRQATKISRTYSDSAEFMNADKQPFWNEEQFKINK